MAACGHEHRWSDNYGGGKRQIHRDLVATIPHGAPAIGFFHPEMQEVVLEAAAEAGAEVRRGARVREVRPGTPPSVVADVDGKRIELSARLVVIADGRGSRSRTQAGFEVQRNPDGTLIAGVLIDGCNAPDDTFHTALDMSTGTWVLIFPQGKRRVRSYVYSTTHWEHRLSGAKDFAAFVDESIAAGLPAEYFDGARQAGPLATFEGAHHWVDHPYRDGVVLVGAAAAASDPSRGQGLSLTLRDARALCDKLSESDEWETAGHAYAEEHDRYWATLHRYEEWIESLFLTTGAEVDARRAIALPAQRDDPSRRLDLVMSGPDVELGEQERRRFFGEDWGGEE